MIAIIDYGLGNVRAFANVYKKLNIPTLIVRRVEDMKAVKKIILPGVGAFDQAMQMLEKSGMRRLIDDLVLYHHVPVLGVCVGMQMLARSSEEGNLPGLGWIDADVMRVYSSSSKRPLPHMGWNDIKAIKDNSLFRNIDQGTLFYFLHSFYMHCNKMEDVIATVNYGSEFTCAVNAGNVYGVQFHPEKSHRFGSQLLKNFAEL